jgi:protein SCO1/2
MMRSFLIALALAGIARAAPVPVSVGFEQRIGESLPLEARFTGSDGVARPLREYLGGKPAVLIFNYFRCPEMCSLVSSGSIDALRHLKLSAGSDFVVITVSIDPTDSAEMARVRRLQDIAHYGRPGAGRGWHTLVGNFSSISALAKAAGFHFAYDPGSRQYAHPSGLIVVTPRGVVASYFMGIDFDASRLAEALHRAAENRTGESVFSLVFICFQGGEHEGRYGRLIWTILYVAVAGTAAALFGGIGLMLAREHRRKEGEGAA